MIRTCIFCNRDAIFCAIKPGNSYAIWAGIPCLIKDLFSGDKNRLVPLEERVRSEVTHEQITTLTFISMYRRLR